MSQETSDNAVTAAIVQEFVTFHLFQTHAKLNVQANQILRANCGLGLNQWRVIALIGQAGVASPSDVVRMSSMDKGLVSRTLKLLIDKGMVGAKRDRRDHRRQKLWLCPQGQGILDRILPIMRARQQHLLDSLSVDERSQILTILHKLEAAVDTWQGKG